MQRAGRAILVQVVVWVILLGALAIGGTYWYQAQNYVVTDDAQITVPMAPVGSLAAGTLESWNVKVGDTVTAGQVLGTVRLPAGAAAVAPAASATSAAAPAATAAAPAAPSAAAPSVNIVAPFAGTILQSDALTGQTVAPGSPLAYVGDLSHPTITANVKETTVRDIQTGQAVDATVDAFPGTTFYGTVNHVGLATAGTFSLLPTSSQAGSFTKVAQRVPIVVDLQGPVGRLIPGESARVKIHIR